MEIKVQLIIGPAFDDLDRLARTLARPRGLLRGVQQGIANELIAHFDQRNTEPNKNNWPKRNFWAGIADRVVAASKAVTNTSAEVSVASPELAHKITGGRIEPQRGSALAIPASAEAYAAGSPREGGAPNLEVKLIMTGRGLVPALVAAVDYQRQVQRGRRTGEFVRAKGAKRGVDEFGQVFGTKAQKADFGKGSVWYWLEPYVDQEADPRAMPSDDALGAAAQSAADDWLDSIMGGRAPEAAARNPNRE